MPFATVVTGSVVRAAGPVSAPGALTSLIHLATVEAQVVRDYLRGVASD
jgi:hypothetical protein